jgi:hypothetical protein
MKDNFGRNSVGWYKKVSEDPPGKPGRLIYYPVLFWVVTLNFSEYTCMIICSHAYTFVSGIEIPSPVKKWDGKHRTELLLKNEENLV